MTEPQQQQHRVRFDGGGRGITTGRPTPAVATCSCGQVGRGKTRASARKALTCDGRKG